MTDLHGLMQLPRKALLKTFGYIPQKDRQNARGVAQEWNRLINEEFPPEIFITNDNYERMLKCKNAKKVTMDNLVTEFLGHIAFKDSLKVLQITGKVLSSNLLRFLQNCQQIEYLVFYSLKQVLGIENNEIFALPKLTTLEIKVRIDQETFTSDELILINTLRNVRFSSLENILITVREFVRWEYDDDDDLDSQSAGYGNDFEDISISTESSLQSTQTRLPPRAIFPSAAIPIGTTNQNPNTGNVQTSPVVQNRQVPETVSSSVTGNLPSTGEIVTVVVQSNVDATARTNPTVVRTAPPVVDASSGSTAVTSRESTYSRIGVMEYEFASRLFNNRIQLQVHNSTDLDSYLNDPTTMNTFRQGNMFNPYVTSNPTTLTTTAFFELLKNNSEKLKKLIVNAKPDFMCFGNISSYSKDLISKVQLENIEYSFGRSQKLCLEFMLLEVQSKLKSLKIHILDDMLPSVMKAAEKSSATLLDLDMKILSLSEDSIDLTPLSRCSSLETLKLFHFFEKDGLDMLPISLTKLYLNGPVTRETLKNFTQRLENLVEFTLILNTQPLEKVDVNLFKQFVFMPKLKKIIFIQSQVDVNSIVEYCESLTGITIHLTGPTEIKEPYTLTNAIQCVAVTINNPQPGPATEVISIK